MNPFVWFLVAVGGLLPAVFFLRLGILAWYWARDKHAALRSRYQATRPPPPDIAGLAPLDAVERRVWEQACAGYGPPPVVVKPGRRSR